MESLISTVCGSEFQTEGAKKRKARLEKSVLVNGWASSGMADERKVRLQIRFRDSVVQLNRSGRGPNVVRQNCQLVCDPLLDWQQPMQLVLPPSLPPLPSPPFPSFIHHVRLSPLLQLLDLEFSRHTRFG